MFKSDVGAKKARTRFDRHVRALAIFLACVSFLACHFRGSLLERACKVSGFSRPISSLFPDSVIGSLLVYSSLLGGLQGISFPDREVGSRSV